MSRLDDIEKRLAALEQGGDLAQRVANLETVLGIGVESVTASKGVHCTRCGMDQNPDFKCAQAKCPLKA